MLNGIHGSHSVSVGECLSRPCCGQDTSRGNVALAQHSFPSCEGLQMDPKAKAPRNPCLVHTNGLRCWSHSL